MGLFGCLPLLWQKEGRLIPEEEEGGQKGSLPFPWDTILQDLHLFVMYVMFFFLLVYQLTSLLARL